MEWRASLLDKGLYVIDGKLMVSGNGGAVVSELGTWPSSTDEATVHRVIVSVHRICILVSVAYIQRVQHYAGSVGEKIHRQR